MVSYFNYLLLFLKLLLLFYTFFFKLLYAMFIDFKKFLNNKYCYMQIFKFLINCVKICIYYYYYIILFNRILIYYFYMNKNFIISSIIIFLNKNFYLKKISKIEQNFQKYKNF